MRSRSDGGSTPQLALPARPPHRRLWRHYQPLSRLKMDTPRAQGFRMPAEWEAHEATWIAWPHNAEDWPGRFEPIPWVYGEIVRKLSQVERVRILIQNDDVEFNARNVLEKCGANWEAIEFYP